ncbi:hypothetical protein K466DRAFT_359587 [Polyporus arcularius HHB13444]|uniref:Uncharacterized protein n=1 Tax=Polyporus arcularius HHB13444 TaxID=1314778 RepID=A0A5C3NUG6_9APHY|nr:hypothetical protein K466DRAFT_359587 [Polyporus arcularius HHB13444]
MIVSDDSSLPFTFKPEDASKWVKVVAAILRRLDIAFPGGRAEDDPGPAPDKDTLSQVNLDIFDLALLSEFEPLDSILAHTSLTKRFRSTSCPRSRWDPSGAGREQLPIYYLPNLGACVSSFLRALASSHAALLRLLHYRNIQGRKLSLVFIHFSGVILPRSGDVVTTDLKQAIHKEMDERLPRFGRQASLPNASTWLEERIKTFQVKHYIHAEAGLMALAVASRSDVRSAVPDDVQDILCSMVDGGQLFVGTTKMCCWTCWRLGELLHRFTRDSAQRFPVEVRLPGQRGVIYAWDPPPGIPLEVLKTLEADLLTALADHAIRCTLVKPGGG